MNQRLGGVAEATNSPKLVGSLMIY